MRISRFWSLRCCRVDILYEIVQHSTAINSCERSYFVDQSLFRLQLVDSGGVEFQFSFSETLVMAVQRDGAFIISIDCVLSLSYLLFDGQCTVSVKQLHSSLDGIKDYGMKLLSSQGNQF